jgi:hypothetical protein
VTYDIMAQLRADPAFSDRVQSCVVEQAKSKPVSDGLAQRAMRNPPAIASMFVPIMTTDQILSDAYASGGIAAVTDQMILAGVQADWDLVSGLTPFASEAMGVPPR